MNLPIILNLHVYSNGIWDYRMGVYYRAPFSQGHYKYHGFHDFSVNREIYNPIYREIVIFINVYDNRSHEIYSTNLHL